MCTQLNLAHVPRTLSYKLWDDGGISLDDRKKIVSEVAGEIFHLKNSVEKHGSKGTMWRSARRSPEQ